MTKRIPVVTAAYTAALLVTNAWLETSTPGYERRMLHTFSTDLVHLVRDPWLVLPGSALFTTGGLPYALAGALICVGLLEVQVGWLVTLLVATSGHLIGTGVSEGVLAIRIAVHDAPSSARHAIDVGPSYILVACATAVIAWRRALPLSRAVCAVAVVPIFIFTAWRIPAGDVDAVGHLTAACIGVAWGWLLSRREPIPRHTGTTTSLR